MLQKHRLDSARLRSKAVINVFIDSNIWLSLYDFSNDDLDQFHKLRDLLEKDVNILLPTTVCDEVMRNRENKVLNVLKQFQPCRNQIPNILKGYDEYSDLKGKMDDLRTLQEKLITKVKNDVANNETHADTVIGEIFEKIHKLDCSLQIMEEAKARFDCGNPPGKDKSYGDAINWVTLLEHAPKNEDLYFISADKDYASPLDTNRFNSFLTAEWESKKKSRLHFYPSLTIFLANHLQSIEISSVNDEQEQLIEQLCESPSFRTTHRVIAELQQYENWTSKQISRLIEAAETNSQISYIINDDDVSNFYDKLLHQYKDIDTDEKAKVIRERIPDSTSSLFDF